MLRALVNKRPNCLSEDDDDENDNRDDSPGNILLEKTKRLKLTNTPGELRLQKDVNALRGVSGIRITPSNTSNSEYFVNFHDELVGLRCPSRFLVAAKKFYPHTAPNIQCLEDGFIGDFIGHDGKLVEGLIEQNWTALCSLSDALDILNKIRKELYFRQDILICARSYDAPEEVAMAITSGSTEEEMN